MVNIILPNREERLELLGERIKNLGNYFKIADDVCPVQLAENTDNFTEDELCRLVHEAATWAMTHSRYGNPDGLQVSQAHFLRSLWRIQPRFGVQRERLQGMMPGGFFEPVRPAQQMKTQSDRDFKVAGKVTSNFQTLTYLSNLWGSLKVQGGTRTRELSGKQAAPTVSSHQESMEEAAGCSSNGMRGMLSMPSYQESMEEAAGCSNVNSMTRWMDDTGTEIVNRYTAQLLESSQRLFPGHGLVRVGPDQGLICQLIEGDPKSGKSAIAARFAQKSNVPFVKVILPEDLLGAGQAEKCKYLLKLLDDAYVSQDSIVILDDLERLLEYSALDKSYSNEVLQALMVLLKKHPPRGHRLHILCTSSRRDILEDLGMLSVFTSVIHVPNLVGPDQILSVAEASQRFEPEELRAIEAAIVDKPTSIGIKRMLDLINWVNPLGPERRVHKFLEKMGAEMGWEKLVD
ncbi:hypothetical protein KR038_011780 [Drosophila bunnanda]|nr:hypothetical protein KR038_011780 [Drosophila bunnanda]